MRVLSGRTTAVSLPEVRGTVDTDGGAYSPSRSILLVLTHDCIITQLYGPTGGDRQGWLNDADAGLRTNLRCRLRRRGCCMLGATSSQLTVPLHELSPARLVLHRQTSAQNGVKGTREGSDEVGHISAFMHPATLAVGNGRAPHPGPRHGEAVAREGGRYAAVRRVSGSEPLSLITHRHRGRSRPLRSAVVEKQAPSVAV